MHKLNQSMPDQKQAWSGKHQKQDLDGKLSIALKVRIYVYVHLGNLYGCEQIWGLITIS